MDDQTGGAPQQAGRGGARAGHRDISRFGMFVVAAVAGIGAIGALGFLMANRSGGDDAPSNAVEREPQDPASAGFGEWSCADLLDIVDDVRRDLLFQDTSARVTAVEDVPLDVLARCLEPYRAILIVTGVPDLDGVWVPDEADALTGMGLAQVDGELFPWFDHGQCFVGGPGEPFQTKATFDLGRGLVTIDVGVSWGDGNPALQLPFVALVAEESDQEPKIVYETAPRTAGATVVRSERFGNRENPWAGIATMRTEAYNSRDFMPYVDGVFDPDNADNWEGSPSYDMTVTVLCG